MGNAPVARVTRAATTLYYSSTTTIIVVVICWLSESSPDRALALKKVAHPVVTITYVIGVHSSATK